MQNLYEDSRQQLISKSKSSDKGRERYNKRNRSRVANTVKSFNQMDMNKLFKEGILTVNIPVHGETDDYRVRITFGGFLEILHDQIKDKNVVELRDISRTCIIGFNKADVFISCTCLHPDTKIPLLDGSCPSVDELKVRYERGEKLYVYSVNQEGEFEPCEIEKVWVTAHNITDFIEVTLDNGKVIRTTPDHRYMLRDGTCCRAEDLVEGISLMPLYFSEANGYKTVKHNNGKGYTSIYKQVAAKFHAQKIAEAELAAMNDGSEKFNYRVAIHHKDFIKSNNTPENLEPMTSYAHWYYHANLCGKERPVSEKMREVARQNAIRRNANPTPAMIEQRKLFNQKGVLRNYDEDRKLQQAKIMQEAITRYYSSTSKEEVVKHRREAGAYSQEWKDKISASQKENWNSNKSRQIEASRRMSGQLNPATRADVRNKISASNKGKSRGVGMRCMSNGTEYIRVNPEQINYYLSLGYVFKGRPKSEETKQKMSASARTRKKYFRNPLTPSAQAEANRANRESRWRRNINELLSKGITLTQEAFDKNKKSGDPAPLKYFSTFEEFLSYIDIHKNYNHKVVSVNRIHMPPCDVYDISVKDCHNFLVDGGVILHNCEDFKYRFQYYATVNDLNSGTPETRPSDITNPDDSLGSGCKHILLVLNNTSWILRVARVINNYIKYMEKHYSKLYTEVMYPAIFGKDYVEPVDEPIEDEIPVEDSDTELETDDTTLDTANEYNKSRTRFQKGNKQGVRFAKSEPEEETNPDDEVNDM